MRRLLAERKKSKPKPTIKEPELQQIFHYFAKEVIVSFEKMSTNLLFMFLQEMPHGPECNRSGELFR